MDMRIRHECMASCEKFKLKITRREQLINGDYMRSDHGDLQIATFPSLHQRIILLLAEHRVHDAGFDGRSLALGL